jgi:hypothetical protein
MRITSSTLTLAALAGALACASNKARTADTATPDQAAAARDTTTTTRDTLNGQNQNPPGYRGMERDTTIAPSRQPTASDTFLQKQGEGTPQDTAGYSGAERVDTTGQGARQNQGAQPNQANPSEVNPSGRTDTTGAAGAAQDTSGMSGMPGMDTTGMNHDSTGMRHDSTGAAGGNSGSKPTGDTTGYHPSQQQSQDTTSTR